MSGKRQRGSRDRWRYCSPPSSKASIRCHYPVRSQPLPLAEAHRRSMWGEGEGQYRHPWVASVPSPAVASHRPLAFHPGRLWHLQHADQPFRPIKVRLSLSSCRWPAGLSFAGFMIPPFTTRSPVHGDDSASHGDILLLLAIPQDANVWADKSAQIAHHDLRVTSPP